MFRQIPLSSIFIIVLILFQFTAITGGVTQATESGELNNTSLPEITTGSIENITETILPTATPTPVPTSSVIAYSMDRTANFNPSPRVSVGYTNATGTRIVPHAVYSEQGIELNGTPQGRMLKVLNGPFIIDYTVHPKVSDPTYGWATLEIRDPWENLIADGGYNRHYLANTNQKIRIHGTGVYYLKMDGNFVTVDYSLLTTDPIPVGTPAPTIAPEEEE